MTETTTSPPPAGPPPAPRRLVRDPDDRVVAGVCAAFGRYTATDPVLWRVTLAVLAVFGGAGLALYLLGWVLVPRLGSPESPVERLVRRDDRSLAVGGVVVAVLGALLLLALIDNTPGLIALAVVGGIAYLVARDRRDSAAPWPPGAPATGTTAAGPVAPPYVPPAGRDEPPGGGYGPPPPVAPWYAGPEPAPPPRPPRERSALGAVTVSAAAVVTGLLLALRAAGADGVTATRVVAAALLVVGAGLLVGTYYGRARWLLALGLLLALALAPVAAVERIGPERGLGQRTWTPTSSAAYAHGIGEATLDLRQLDVSGDATVEVRAELGAGRLLVLVPDDLTVLADVDVRFGEVRGLDGILRDGDGPGWREQELLIGPPGPARARLDLELVVGELEVQRVTRTVTAPAPPPTAGPPPSPPAQPTVPAEPAAPAPGAGVQPSSLLRDVEVHRAAA